jgi:rSAM/selenodomain-associated transferase 1
MSYPIFNPRCKNSALASNCALAVMAKAPRAGKVKTRLSPPLTLEQSAALNICFLRDTTRNIADVAAMSAAIGLVCYTPIGDESLFDGLLPEGFALIPQRGDTFGERLHAASEDILACGFGSVCLIDSDSPTVPAGAFHEAIELLNRCGDRIVLGGSNDGGYYLIGLKAPHREPFTGIHWSTSTVYAETVSAIREAEIELAELPIWYDIDDGDTLNLLRDELLGGMTLPFANIPGYPAPHSREFIHRFFGVSK